MSAGVPLITGAWLVPVELAEIEKVGNETAVCPSLTLMRMLLHVPDEIGAPLRAPLVVENAAQLGLFAIENVRAVCELNVPLSVGRK